MSAAVAQRANGMSKALGARRRSSTRSSGLPRVQNTEVSVELGGTVAGEVTRREARMHDVIVANGQWHGGAMWLAPEARPDDGVFDVV